MPTLVFRDSFSLLVASPRWGMERDVSAGLICVLYISLFQLCQMVYFRFWLLLFGASLLLGIEFLTP